MGIENWQAASFPSLAALRCAAANPHPLMPQISAGNIEVLSPFRGIRGVFWQQVREAVSVPAMNLAILLLLAQHESLAAEQIAEELADPLDAVNATLRQMRDRGAMDVLSIGELEGHRTRPASYWRLTDQGRDELAKLR